MNKVKNYEKSVPENYVCVKHVNAKDDKKQITIYSLLSIVPIAIILPLMFIIAYFVNNYDVFKNFNQDKGYIAVLIAGLVYFLYIVLHEITHGITYKCFTGEKLTFGMTLAVAFCGVPEIYVRKKAAVAALIMPFVVFTLIFGGLTIGLWFISPSYGIVAGTILALHMGGCMGDLHWTSMYITKYKHCNTLMRDTGPEQWLYVPLNEATKYNLPIIEIEENIKTESEN